MSLDLSKLLMGSRGLAAPAHSARMNTPQERILTALLLTACFVLFLGVRRASQYVSFPDENFDYLEQAYRLLHGYGTSTWTYELGIRSWIFPGLLAGAMWLGSLFGDAATERTFAHGFVALSTLLPVWCAMTWCRWLWGTGWSLLAGIFVATWFEIPYWATVTLSEIFAANLLCLCIHLGFLFDMSHKSKHLAAFGALLGLVFCIRFQFAIFLFLIAFLVCSLDWRRWLLIAGCAGGVILASGLLDWLTLGLPFQSIWLNALANSVVPISEYGIAYSPFYRLTDIELVYWSWGAILLLACAVAGFRWYPGLAIVAAAIWVFHSLLSNQQTRFLYPAILLIVIAAGIGAVSIIRPLKARLPKRWAWSVTSVMLTIWMATSAFRAVEGPFAVNWVHRSGYVAMADYVRRHAEICGLAMSSGTGPTVGYAFVGRNIPFYHSAPSAGFENMRPHVNAVVTSQSNQPPDGYTRVVCWNDGYGDFFGKKPNDKICLNQRAGQCFGAAPPDREVWPKSAIQLKRFVHKPYSP